MSGYICLNCKNWSLYLILSHQKRLIWGHCGNISCIFYNWKSISAFCAKEYPEARSLVHTWAELLNFQCQSPLSVGPCHLWSCSTEAQEGEHRIFSAQYICVCSVTCFSGNVTSKRTGTNRLHIAFESFARGGWSFTLGIIQVACSIQRTSITFIIANYVTAKEEKMLHLKPYLPNTYSIKIYKILDIIYFSVLI